MDVNKDFEDLLHLLNSAHIRYLVVGAYAVIFHAEPRYTKDIDIWVDPKFKNAKKVYDALKRFGAPVGGLTVADLMNPRMVYQIGVEPNRIDILMGIGRGPFHEAWKRKRTSRYGKERMHLLGMKDLVRAKEEAGRPKDKIDLETLAQVRGRRKRKKGTAN